MLGITYNADGSSYTTGNVQTLTGMNMADGFSFDYPYKQLPDNYVDEFGEGSGSLAFLCQDGKGRVGYYSGPSGDYRTITSAVIFGALEDGTSTKADLLETYMDYLTGGTGIGSGPSSETFAGCLEVVTPSTGTLSAVLTVTRGCQCDIGVYDITGRRVGTLHSGSIDAGTHSLVMSGSIPPGTYVIYGNAGNTQLRGRTVLLRQ